MLHIWIVILLCVLSILPKSAFVASDPNCCALNETRLLALGLGKFFSSSPFVGSFTSRISTELGAKCDTCPEGMCRVNMNCYSIRSFLENRSPKPRTLCTYSFGVIWPKSVGKEDTTWRSCRRKPNSTRVADNCCSLTKAELEERVGISDLCPTRSTSINPVRRLKKKCDLCPFGTCRVGLNCYCPKDFLESIAYRELCRSSFTEKWNKSVGLEDTHWRSCTQPTPLENNTFDNCCALTNQQLESRIGRSKFCPLFGTSTFNYVETVEKECDPCPFGTCRAASGCFCPADFLKSDAQKALCQNSFGEPHPDSVGKPDKLCPANPTPELQSPAPTITPKVSKSPDVTPSPIPSVTTVQPTSGPPQGDTEQDSAAGLNSSEIIGAVASITGILGFLVACFVCYQQKQWRKKTEGSSGVRSSGGDTDNNSFDTE